MTGSEEQHRSGRAARQAEWAPHDRALLRALGHLVRRARRARRLTIAAAARLVGVDPSYLGELERGRANVSVTTLAAFSRALEVPLRELVPEKVDRDELSRDVDGLSAE